MNQFKRAKVVMLFSSRNSGCLTQNRHSLKLDIGGAASTADNRHLYIISDDEIKEGDWFHLDMSDNDHPDEIHQMGKNNWSKTGGINFNNNHTWSKCCKKIIATTDTSLFITQWEQTNKKSKCYNVQANIENTKLVKKQLPQPSQQFIEKYIESYNKGEVITDVLVEYEQTTEYLGRETIGYSANGSAIKIGNYKVHDPVLKINPKDNTITIKKIKDNWSREEVVKLLNKLTDDWNDYNKVIVLNKWIEENL